jgi:phosphatidate cytidylyltransferase
MALNIKIFQTRAATAVVFVAVMAVGLLWNQWSFFVLFSIVHFGCWIEYQKLVSLFNADYKNSTRLHKWGIMVPAGA